MNRPYGETGLGRRNIPVLSNSKTFLWESFGKVWKTFFKKFSKKNRPLTIPPIFNRNELAAEGAGGLAGGHNDLAVGHFPGEVGATRGVKLREDVVEEEDGLFAADLRADVTFGKLHRKS